MTAALLLVSTVAWAQQSQELTQKYYPEPEGVSFTTPSFVYPCDDATNHASYTDIMTWISERVDKDPRAALSYVGKTADGYDIPLVRIHDSSRGKAGSKVKVYFQGVLHGNEPASTEGVLMLLDYVLGDPEGSALLENTDLYIMPMANVDGYMAGTRASALKYDLNRDQTKYADPQSAALRKVFLEIDPDMAVDFHEFNPFKSDYKEVGGAIFYDTLFLPTGHPNVDPGIRDAIIRYIRKPAEKTLESEGYSHYTYFTRSDVDGRMALVCGARSAQSSSTSWSLSNAISILVELRGIGMGKQCFERRTYNAFLIARSVLEQANQNAGQIKRIVSDANRRTIKAKAPVAALFHSNRHLDEVTFLDLQNNKTVKTEAVILDALDCTVDIERSRPVAYAIEASQTKAIENLKTLGLEVEILSRDKAFETESYVVTEDVIAEKEWEKIHTRKVSVRVEKGRTTLPAGTAIVRMNQQNANYAPTVLEPESENGFVAFRVVEVQLGKTLPVYRIVKK